MKHEYDLFERFPDGSSLWRDSALGLENTRHRLQELTQKSENHFYAIDLTNGESLAIDSKRDVRGPQAPSPTERHSKSQAA